MFKLFSLFLVLSIISKENAWCNVTMTDYYKNTYGEGFGTDWIYFPDGDGMLHYVSLRDEGGADVRGGYKEVEFRLYTRLMNKSENSIILSETAEPLINIGEIDLSNSIIKIITHGWRSSAESVAVASLKNAYLRSQNVNVITVDWSTISNSFLYHWVASQTINIAAVVAIFLNGLNERYNVTGNQIHLIGHSLGAHIMGIAANRSTLIIDRITGLDPARPLFEFPNTDLAERLDPTDAIFVDVIHTSAGVLGFQDSIGTADFYPNGGFPPQPGCETIPRVLEACSHGRSYIYFAESIITPKAFPAYQCNDWKDYLANRCKPYGYMGEYVNRENKGNYFLRTNSESPFGWFT